MTFAASQEFARGIYRIWAPDDVKWSAWVSPVAFVDAEPQSATAEKISSSLDLLPDPGAGTMVVVDLPGSESVFVGLALARRGLRPIPMFGGTSAPGAFIDVRPITRSLVAAAEELRRLEIPRTALPAFLLDWRRFGAGVLPKPDQYDNRWLAFPDDFPSATTLAESGITDSMVIHAKGLHIASDLSHVMRGWQSRGIRVHVFDASSGRFAKSVEIPPSSLWHRLRYRIAALLGRGERNVGGFGTRTPGEPFGGRG